MEYPVHGLNHAGLRRLAVTLSQETVQDGASAIPLQCKDADDRDVLVNPGSSVERAVRIHDHRGVWVLHLTRGVDKGVGDGKARSDPG